MSLVVGLRASAGRDGRIQFAVPRQFASTLAAGAADSHESEFDVVHGGFDAMTTLAGRPRQ